MIKQMELFYIRRKQQYIRVLEQTTGLLTYDFHQNNYIYTIFNSATVTYKLDQRCCMIYGHT